MAIACSAVVVMVVVEVVVIVFVVVVVVVKCGDVVECVGEEMLLFCFCV